MEDVLKAFGVVMLLGLAAFTVICIGYTLDNWPPKVNAKPVTTEIPEYTMKCTVFEDTCKEYTIYRITRN